MQSRPRLRSHGFTLVELLVVVALITILLAMLMPAMEKAVYAADLVRCGANLDATVGGALLYAMDFQRAYPAAEIPRDAGYQPDLIGRRDNNNQSKRDVRPIVTGYMNLRQWLDPLCGRIDLSIEANDADTRVFANYDIWFSFRYEYSSDDGSTAVPRKGLRRTGDRFEALDSRYGTGQTYAYRLIASDKSLVRLDSGTQSSHPDPDGRMAANTGQNDTRNPAAELGNIAVGGTKLTSSRWGAGGGIAQRRGLLDLNFGYDDGSVVRLEGVTIEDDRLRPAPAHSNDGVPDWDILIPQ